MNELVAMAEETTADIGETTEVAWIAPTNMTYDEWCGVGRTLQQIHKSINFWLGDWLNAGERRFGEMAVQAVEETGRGIESLLKCKAVSARYAPHERFENLSWSHHLAAAYMDEAFRHEVLSIADRYEISTRDLKLMIAMPVRLLGDLIQAYRNEMGDAEFYRLIDIKRVEAAEWDSPVISGEVTQLPVPEYLDVYEVDPPAPVAQDEGDDDDLPFVDLGAPDGYDWTDHLEQNIDSVFSYFEAHGAPLKAIYMAEVLWEGLMLRAEIDGEGRPLLVWEIVP